MIIQNSNILVIDDDTEIWQAYNSVLVSAGDEPSARGEIAELLGVDDVRESSDLPDFRLSFASQGKDGYEMVRNALKEENPFAVAFIDIRMPPGWDGMKTAAAIRSIDPDIEFVIVTAYSDRTREEIVREVGSPDKLLFLRKPFDPEELTQLALALSSKWNLVQMEKAALIALAESQARFRALVETTSDCVWEMDSQGRITYCSPVSEIIYGYSPEELVGKNYYDFLLCSKDTAKAIRFFEDCVKNLKGFQSVERCCVTKEGERVYVESSATHVVLDGEVVSFRGIDRDISERKRNEATRQLLEEQLRQSQKMEALGVLAGGIAHDLNNVLMPIMGNAQLAQMNIGNNSSVTENLMEIQKSGERAANLIRQILTFSRKQVMQLKVINLNKVIEDFFKMLRRLIRSDIELILDLDKELWSVKADIGQMEQILINLVVNARDALSTDGTIIIRTKNETVPDKSLFDVDHNLISGSFAVVSVIDNGDGMDKETQARIFDPFFTTKEVGMGTGLGLSTVYGVVKQHIGHLRLESSPKRGAHFQIYLRKTEQLPGDAFAGFESLVKGGTETVLVAEDNVAVRKVVGTTLTSFGYKVIEAADGKEAVKILKENANSIDLLLTDLVMPGLGGRAVAGNVSENYPALPVIIMSAYARDDIHEETVGLEKYPFIQKPFTPQELARLIRSVLDGEVVEGGRLP
ncbi:MAG: response regulator [Proteobacteria bacterium]|nr:response regulator [Pseudomonadota bacterium]